ncbi:uncharacterized protein N7529_012086 [Penicillium soppii]|uniref:uncharacterized protein n=1 Tax=Penicillium soppii TaxID=69789 RepID=UPI0025498F11|nr:uncharacterized protein N7529_012086 [Penicillium soppii]KAJ5852701.1 hypothetical protein N7529_012086 [Penicillium soppii]
MDTVISNLPLQIIAMFSIGAYNALEVVLSIFEGFKKYRGLYFWSMQVAAWGILIHAIAAQIRYLSRASNLSMTIPFSLGWICMVSGQAVVLYSRLHLVVHDVWHIRWVLWMIIASFFILHTPMTALFFCLNLGDARCARPAAIFDRIQVTGFGLQDTIICAIYMREALRALQPIFAMKGREGRRIIYWLLVVNFLSIILDICIIAAEFELHYIAISFKTVAYSIKLKLEFYALTQLRELTRTYPCTMCQGIEGNARVSSDINIFDMLASRPRPANIEEQTMPSFMGTASPPPVHSTRGSTYDFHEALRQTVSNEPSVHSHGESRPPFRSSDTQSTVEMTFLETPK